MITVTEIANKYVGIRYLNNGRDPKVGLDCWGLIMCIAKDMFDIEIPDTNYDWKELVDDKDFIYDQFDLSSWVTPVKVPKFGDLLMLEVVDGFAIHCGIFLGNDKFIHTTLTKGVVVSSYSIYSKKISGVYRLNSKYKEIKND